MPSKAKKQFSAWRFVRLLLLGVAMFVFFVGFVFWRVDNPRVERLRFVLMDQYLPDIDGIFAPVARFGGVVAAFRSYEELERENRELRRELQKLESWREAALQFEQANAELRALNSLALPPKISFVTGEIIADSGSPFSQTAIINIGRNKGLESGAPVVDGFGLIGRITGVGQERSRILLLSDPSSQISALIMPDRTRAIVRGNNSNQLAITVIDTGARLRAGARVVTSGDGIFPSELLIGRLVVDAENHPSVRIASDYAALGFARVFLSNPASDIETARNIVVPNPDDEREFEGPQLPTSGSAE